MKDRIKYKKGYKYQLGETYACQTDVTGYSIDTRFISLSGNGILTIRHGYAWDGPSGPTFDTPDFMRGSLVHDALYQLMREGLLPKTERNRADKELKKICLADGMPTFRANYVFFAVDHFAASCADPENKRPVLTAP